MTSPGRIPAFAKGPSPKPVTSTPPLIFKSFFLASDSSLTITPKALALLPFAAGASVFLLAAWVDSVSVTVTVKSRVPPLRQTCTDTEVPGFVSPTTLGKSVDLEISRPLKLRITSPASIPPAAAGPPGSTLRTYAPRGLPKPRLSATSFVISPKATPIRPRVILPLVRNWSATRIASSIGIAKEMPI